MKMHAYIIVSLAIFNDVALSETTKKIEKQDNHSNETCGGVFSDNNFFLQSPNYPGKYPPNLRCIYVFKGPACSSYYKFDFIDFELENSVGCVKDRLLIGNQDALCGKVKGNKGYFTSKGSLNVKFSTDHNTGDRGFKIFVSRMPCENSESEEKATTEVTETIVPTTLRSQTTTKPFHPFHLSLPNPGRNPPRCCSNSFNSTRFLITSPNFPYSLNNRQECVIKIQKSHENICRLRLSFLFFWLGSYNYNNCPYGYIRIDGKFICGCNKELKLITTFEDEDVKELVYRSEGINVDSQSGFVMEVVQDECPSKYFPMNKQRFPEFSQKFNFTENLVKRAKKLTVDDSLKEAHIEQAQLITEKTEILKSENFSAYSDSLKLVKQMYFFVEPDFNGSPVFSNETEPTNYVDTSTVSVIVTNTNQVECTNWNKVQINNVLSKYGNNVQTCKKSEECKNNRRSNCVELNYLRGYFRSPGYPFFYPKWLNTCFRFRKQPGYCAIRLYFSDFQLENSYGCRKDYVLLENRYRYCGKSLLGRYITFDLTSKNFEDLIFVTDFFFCGRGFYGVYEQLPCQQPTIPINPTPYPTIIPSPTPNALCDRYIPDKLFILEVNQNKQQCTFEIRKFTKSACKVVFYFEKFDLFCGSESLQLNNMNLCGHLTGRKVSVNFDDYNEIITIVYKSNLLNKYGDLKFKISGEQITDDCLVPEPPVQLISAKKLN